MQIASREGFSPLPRFKSPYSQAIDTTSRQFSHPLASGGQDKTSFKKQHINNSEIILASSVTPSPLERGQGGEA